MNVIFLAPATAAATTDVATFASPVTTARTIGHSAASIAKLSNVVDATPATDQKCKARTAAA
jgi:hypothetical protein